jgi:hypothetical protein
MVIVTPSGTAKAKASRPSRGGGGGGGIGGNTGAAPPPPKPAAPPAPTGLFTAYDGTNADNTRTLSPEEQKRAKFNPSVLAVIDRLKAKNAIAGVDEAKFIHNGKAEIQIWLTEKSDETIAALKALGFEVVLDPKSAKLVIGRLPIEKLAALADLKTVRYVAPQI